MRRLLIAKKATSCDSVTTKRRELQFRLRVRKAINGGFAYLRWRLSYYCGNFSYALSRHNAGEGRVDRYKGVPPFPETRDYAARVMALYRRNVHVFDESITAASPMLK